MGVSSKILTMTHVHILVTISCLLVGLAYPKPFLLNFLQNVANRRSERLRSGNGYNDPQDGYNIPQDEYNVPQDEYNVPQDEYNVPQDGYTTPESGYNSPVAPKDEYNIPAPGYNEPSLCSS